MNLERTRKALRMTQAEIAELVGISRNAWRALETGEAKPHSETLERFRDLLQAVVSGTLLMKDEQWALSSDAIETFGVDNPGVALEIVLDEGLSPLTAMISVLGYDMVRGALIRNSFGFGRQFLSDEREEAWMLEVLTIMPDSPVLGVLRNLAREGRGHAE